MVNTRAAPWQLCNTAVGLSFDVGIVAGMTRAEPPLGGGCMGRFLTWSLATKGALALAVLVSWVASLQVANAIGHESLHPLLGAPPMGSHATPATGSIAGVHTIAAVLQQDLNDQATLETRQPEVQWSARGDTPWQDVPSRQTVQSGDRVR